LQIAKLIQELARFGNEAKLMTAHIQNQKDEYEGRIDKLRKQNTDLVNETVGMTKILPFPT